MSKDDFYTIGRRIRSFASRCMEFGPTAGPGLDGELSTAVLFQIFKYIKTSNVDSNEPFLPDQFVLELGSGTGISSYLLSYALNIKILGFEVNPFRSFYSWYLQEKMLNDSSCSEFQDLAKSCMFMNTDAYAGLKTVFGAEMPIRNAAMSFTFCEGWNPADIHNATKYLNDNVTGLKWIICDMPSSVLQECGFRREIYSSQQFSGRLVKSTNSRTIYVHRVKSNSSLHSSTVPTQEEAKFIAAYSNDRRVQIRNNLRVYWASVHIAKVTRSIRHTPHHQVPLAKPSPEPSLVASLVPAMIDNASEPEKFILSLNSPKPVTHRQFVINVAKRKSFGYCMISAKKAYKRFKITKLLHRQVAMGNILFAQG